MEGSDIKWLRMHDDTIVITLGIQDSALPGPLVSFLLSCSHQGLQAERKDNQSVQLILADVALRFDKIVCKVYHVASRALDS